MSLIEHREKLVCLEIDSEEPGGYRQSINLSLCHNNKERFSWVLNPKDPTRGTCYQTYALGGEIGQKRAKSINCRPKKVVTKWIIKDPESPLVGGCYEVAKEGGTEGYIQVVSRMKCLPKEPLVANFFHPKKFKNGGCYLVNSQTEGGLYS